MYKTVYLNPNDVPAQLRRGKGQKYSATITDSVDIPIDAGLWDGGSRSTYFLTNIATGEQVPAAPHNAFHDGRAHRTIKLEPGYCVTQYSMFRGKDMGAKFYMRPDDVAPMLPKSVDLSRAEKFVLYGTSRFKSSYNGQDRYDMTASDCRWEKGVDMITRDEWIDAKQALIDKGLLRKNGSITPDGRNQAPKSLSDID